MMLGRESPTLPRFLASRRISTRHIASLVTGAVPLLERLGTVIHPRLPTPFEATKRRIGVIVRLLAAICLPSNSAKIGPCSPGATEPRRARRARRHGGSA
jgi:hypothetical protein